MVARNATTKPRKQPLLENRLDLRCINFGGIGHKSDFWVFRIRNNLTYRIFFQKLISFLVYSLD